MLRAGAVTILTARSRFKGARGDFAVASLRSARNVMWAYQKHFQVNAQVAAESIFQRLDPRVMPRVWILGFLAREADDRPNVVVVPDDAPFPADLFTAVPGTARLLAETEPPPQTTSVSRKAEERRQAQQELRHFQVALQRQLDQQTKAGDDVAFCSWPVAVEDYRVFVVLQLPRDVFQAYHSLRKSHVTSATRTLRVYRSLLEAAINEFLRVCAEQLGIPDPGAGSGILEDPGFIVLTAGRNLMHTPAVAGQVAHARFGLYDACNTISTLKYERQESAGRIYVARRDHPFIRCDLKLHAPVSLTEHWAVRRLLQLAAGAVGLLCDGSQVYGLGGVVDGYDPTGEDLFAIHFLRHFVWELQHAGRSLMQVRYGLPSLPLSGFADDKFKSDLQRRLGQLDRPDVDTLALLARTLARQPHGAMLVVSRAAAAEADRLRQQCICTDPVPLTPETLAQASKLDGAVLVDPQGRCHAIGVILDGVASERCSPSRGSRYNSAVRYVESHPDCLVVVKSEDGLVNVVPDLKPTISRIEQYEAIQQLRAVVAHDEVEPWQLHQAMSWFERHRFYLMPGVCDEVNRLWRQGNERLVEDAWRLQYPDFVPNSEMNDSYFHD